MLTDIFAIRYEETPIFKLFGVRETRVLHQCFTILEEFHPYWGEEKSRETSSETFWKEVHKRVANELGQRWLSHPFYTAMVGLAEYRREESRHYPHLEIVRNWYSAKIQDDNNPDMFIKERLSVVEVGFRLKYEVAQNVNESLKGLSQNDLLYLTGKPQVERYESAVDELNTRFRQGRLPLNYHNGFIQLEKDGLIAREIEQPFWSVVSDPIWANVDLDMKEALDQLDTGGKDPAFYAGKALESTLKIISNGLGVTHGGERGAHNFIDNLGRQGVQFVEKWEAEQLKEYFTKIRNPLGHGPGHEPMPALKHDQSSWAIEVAMSWIKMLVQRYTTIKCDTGS
ncbi:MAG: hypothetical protein ABF313_22350 [Marivita sp.]